MVRPMAPRFTRTLSVEPEHIDVLGHVSNQVYLAWLLAAAEDHSSAVGLSWARYREIGGVFVVRRHELDYLAPAFVGEQVQVETWISGHARASSTRAYTIHRGERCLMRAQTKWAFIDLDSGRPTRIPAEVLEAFEL